MINIELVRVGNVLVGRLSAIEGFTYKTVKGEMEGPTVADLELFAPTVFAYGKVA